MKLKLVKIDLIVWRQSISASILLLSDQFKTKLIVAMTIEEFMGGWNERFTVSITCKFFLNFRVLISDEFFVVLCILSQLLKTLFLKMSMQAFKLIFELLPLIFFKNYAA